MDTGLWNRHSMKCVKWRYDILEATIVVKDTLNFEEMWQWLTERYTHFYLFIIHYYFLKILFVTVLVNYISNYVEKMHVPAEFAVKLVRYFFLNLIKLFFSCNCSAPGVISTI